MLNKTFRAIAADLRRARPAVYPGTNVCMDRQSGVMWFGAVFRQRRKLAAHYSRKALPRKWSQFCDLCGVPD